MATEAIQSSFAIIRWPFIVTPRERDKGVESDPQYCCTPVIGGPNGLRQGDKDFLTVLMKAMDDACIAKWNVGVTGMMQRMAQANKSFNVALKRNNMAGREKYDAIRDAPDGFHFEARTKFVPDMFDAQGQMMAAADPNLFYDGFVGRVWVSAYTYEHPKSGPGVGLNLHGVQFAQHAPKLGGVAIAVTAVDANELAGLPSAPAPTNVTAQTGVAYGQGEANPPGPTGTQAFGFDQNPAGGAGAQGQAGQSGAKPSFGF